MKQSFQATVLAITLATSGICSADTVIPDRELISALGKVRPTKNSREATAYDFSRSRHDLRLEDIVLNATNSGDGSRIKGTFTLTHLYKGPLGITIRPADHILVSFTAENGETKAEAKGAKGENPWPFIITVGATANGANPLKASAATASAARIGSILGGDAGPFMGQVVTQLTDRLAALSAKKFE
jgi:hypothetical protein